MTLIVEREPGTFRGLIAPAASGPIDFPDPPRDPVPLLRMTVLDAHDAATMATALGAMTAAAELEHAIDGTPTLSVDVADPARVLIRSGACSSAARIECAGRRYMLASVERPAAGGVLRLTFEAEAVALLKRYTKPRTMYRDKVTRAQFLESLVREVKERDLRFDAPHDVKIITAKPAATAATPNAAAAAGRGADTFRRARVKGTLANGEQRRMLALAMRICDELNVTFWLRVGLVACMTQESVITHLPLDNAGSVGVLQAMPRYFGQRAYSDDWQIRHILTRGFTGSHGYEGVIRSYANRRWGGNVIRTFLHHLNPGAIDGGGLEGNYRQWWEEARTTVHLWTDGGTGGSGSEGSTDTNGTTAVTVQRYAFRRGQSGQKENSWTAMRRLADEVGWSVWCDGDVIRYAPQDWLIRQPAKWTIVEDGPGIDSIGYTIDHGRVRDQLTAKVSTDRYQVAVGDAAVVDGEGPADGKWIVAGVRRGLFDADTELTLKRAAKRLPEPAPETTTTTTTTLALPGGSGGGGAAAGAAKVVDYLRAHVGEGNVHGGPAGQWCAFYVHWILRNVAGLRSDSANPNYVPTLISDIRAHRSPFVASVPESSAQPGDVICWGGHTGFYIGNHEAISGNWSNRVSRHGWKDPGAIYAVGRPGYRE